MEDECQGKGYLQNRITSYKLCQFLIAIADGDAKQSRTFLIPMISCVCAYKYLFHAGLNCEIKQAQNKLSGIRHKRRHEKKGNVSFSCSSRRRQTPLNTASKQHWIVFGVKTLVWSVKTHEVSISITPVTVKYVGRLKAIGALS